MKLIRVRMDSGEITTGEVGDQYQGLGGRGLTSCLIADEVPPRCDPLGPENKLIFAPGFLSGTPLANTSRLSIGAKSPLTGGIKESNVGGTAGAMFARLGIGALVVEGTARAGQWYLLRIDGTGSATLLPAAEYAGMRTYALVAKLLETWGATNTVLAIGPAGEQQLASASIQGSDVDGHPCRAAGRGGLGAVMGSKGLKAVVVEQVRSSVQVIADPPAFREASREIARLVRADTMSGEVMPELGTASLVAPVNSMGAFPSFNARCGVFPDWQKISGETMADLIKQRGGNPTHAGCSQCMIRCSNVFVDPAGAYVTSSLEYETIWAMGGMLGIADLDVIARLDFLCDDIGLDTMNTGVAIAVALDSGYRPFGDAKAVIEMVEEIARGTPFGRILGSGPAAVGRHFGNPRVPAVKHQSVAAYDPRAMLGHGVTFATSPMGADHTAGNLVGAYLGHELDPLVVDGQVAGSRRLQIAMAAFDCAGLCFMASAGLSSLEANAALRRLLTARFGVPFEPGDFPHRMGVRILNVEREFNRRAGLTSRDDRLPRFYYEEPLPPHGTVFTIGDAELDSTLDFRDEPT